MRYQSTAASCGPTALRNGLRARGIERSEDELAALSGCTVDGTGAKGMLAALRKIAVDHPELTPAVLTESRPDIALLRLLEAHRCGSVVILSVDQDEHWVVSFGLLGSGAGIRLHVADSQDGELIRHYTPSALLERWRGLGRRPYYGIIV